MAQNGNARPLELESVIGGKAEAKENQHLGGRDPLRTSFPPGIDELMRNFHAVVVKQKLRQNCIHMFDCEPHKSEQPPEYFGFLLVPGFPLAAFASAVDVLALANYASGKELYRWCTISVNGEDVKAMNGFRSLPNCSISNAPVLNAITVCCGIGAARRKMKAAENWLRARYRLGTRIGSISTGSWLLARAGLLDGKRCTIHWEDVQAFRECFPTLHATSEIFEIDGRVFTCSGGSAATDMFLSFVAARHGVALAKCVAEQLVHGSPRDDSTSQRLKLQERMGITNRHLMSAITLMEGQLEEPYSHEEIAQRTSISVRHLERLFRKYLGRTPQHYYREIRLRHARSLLRTTNLSVLEVACASGFCSSSYLAKCYAEQFGLLPRDERGSLVNRTAIN